MDEKTRLKKTSKTILGYIFLFFIIVSILAICVGIYLDINKSERKSKDTKLSYLDIKWHWNSQIIKKDLKDRELIVFYPEEDKHAREMIFDFISNYVGPRKSEKQIPNLFYNTNIFLDKLPYHDEDLQQFQMQYKKLLLLTNKNRKKESSKHFDLHHVYVVDKNNVIDRFQKGLFYFSQGKPLEDNQQLLAYSIFIEKNKKNAVFSNLIELYGEPNSVKDYVITSGKKIKIAKWKKGTQVLMSYLDLDGTLWLYNYKNIAGYLEDLESKVKTKSN